MRGRPFTLCFQERGWPSLDLKARSRLKKTGSCNQGSTHLFPGQHRPTMLLFWGVRVLDQNIQDSPQNYLFSPPALCFFHAERSPGNDWHADDGLHGGDGERGEGDDLHPSVFMRERGRGNPIWHRRRGYHLDQQGVCLCFLLVELTVLLNITYLH